MNLRAVEQIYQLKNRAKHKPLSLLITDVAQAYGLARECDTAFDRLGGAFLAWAADDHRQGRAAGCRCG